MIPQEPLAREELKLGNFEQALAIFEKIGERDAFYAEITQCRYMLTVKAAYDLLKEQAWEASREKYRDAAHLLWDVEFAAEGERYCNFRILVNEGDIHFEEKKWRDAVRCYERSLEKANLAPFLLDDFALSVDTVSKVLSTKIQAAKAQYWLTESSEAQAKGNWLKARGFLRKVREFFPAYPGISNRIKELNSRLKDEYQRYLSEGEQLYASGNLPQAKEKFELAYRIHKSKKLKHMLSDCINKQANEMLIELSGEGKIPGIGKLNVPHFDLKSVKEYKARRLQIGYFPANLLMNILDEEEDKEA